VSGLVEGSAISGEELIGRADHATDGSAGTGCARWEAVVLTGPDSGARIDLPPGRHVIGRAPGATIAVADPQLEPHHALVTVGERPDEAPRIVQLTGSTPIEVRADVTSDTVADRGGGHGSDITREASGSTAVLAGRTRFE